MKVTRESFKNISDSAFVSRTFARPPRTSAAYVGRTDTSKSPSATMRKSGTDCPGALGTKPAGKQVSALGQSERQRERTGAPGL